MGEEPQRIGQLSGLEGCSIEFTKPGELRARKVVRRSNHRVTGKQPSFTLRRHTQWEGPGERALQRILDACPDIPRYQEQPAIVSYNDASNIRRHFPDLLVQAHAYRGLWEVKTDEDAIDPEIAHRTAILTISLPRLGYDYRVVTYSEIFTPPFFDNACLLLRYGRRPVELLDWERTRRSFLSGTIRAWADILDGALGPRGRAIVCRLMLEGTIDFDPLLPIGPTTQLVFSENRELKRRTPWVFQLFKESRSSASTAQAM